MSGPPLLSSSFPWHFGGYTPAPGLEALEGTELAWVDSHGDRAVELLLSQFRDKPLIEAVVRALVAGVQDLEDGVWQVLTERWLDTSEGVQLDGLGQFVDLPRQGWTDATYRNLIRAQIRVYQSRGRWSDLVGILELVGVDLETVTISEPGTAAITVMLSEPVSDAIAVSDIFRLLVQAKAAGVRFILEYPAAELDESFTWADGDAEQADSARGWANDAETTGGYWAGSLATSEVL